jgi:hypothetical protein
MNGKEESIQDIGVNARFLGRPRFRQVENTKMDVSEIRGGGRGTSGRFL